ncbi:DNA polymerase III subunit delta [uncultured Adlercreutzia sp.]|uniref:DNA polymerase III subunit delta n=1 Tax=uncultured Adlercreutzia sp. TaxID=875803 RepID=UPI0025E63C36|nr:DNA polymerase III subunit delta [uncultured Adlercreutzia sp.]MCI9261127.1 DNA polymerase III subunit delta [Eggerthellaceae bacterium]
MSDTKTSPEFLGAYLVVGEDALKRETVIKRLRARLEKLGDIAFNSDDFDGEVATGEEIVSACNTVPFASPYRLVYVRNAEKLKKADSEPLVEYLKAPNATTVLALEAEKLAKSTRLYKAVAALGAKAVISCAPPKSWELPKQVRAMATSHGIVMTEGAAAALVELVGEDTVHLDSELQKIALSHQGADAVTDREVRALVARTSEVKPWNFTDAYADRNLARCLTLLSMMDSASPLQLIALCTGRIRELMCAQSLNARGEGGMLAKTLGLPDWRVKNHRAQARRFTAAELRHALAMARDAEQAIKSGADDDETFRAWVVETLKRP